MGWWNQTKDGLSLQVEDTGLLWGDQPADAMDDALVAIVAAFIESVGRRPSKEEVRAGLEFSIGIDEDDAVGVRKPMKEPVEDSGLSKLPANFTHYCLAQFPDRGYRGDSLVRGWAETDTSRRPVQFADMDEFKRYQQEPSAVMLNGAVIEGEWRLNLNG